MLTLAEALERLRDPRAPEHFSPLGTEPLLVLDLATDAPRAGAACLAGAREALATLPCPTLGLRTGSPSAASRALAPALDLVLEPDQLDAVREAVRHRPLASLALVQLLRGAATRDIEQGLVAESLVYAALQGGPEFAAWRAAQTPRDPPTHDGEPAVLALREGDRLRLTLNRPGRRNAYSAAMRDALVEGLALAVADTSIARVVLSGAGAAFCAGGDLGEFGTLPDPATAHAVRSTRSAARLLARCAGRVRAELHGACIGAGIELPAFAGRVAAREDSVFALPELSMGLVPGAGGTVSLPRRIGRQRVAWLALTGRRIGAQTALDWGLVDELSRAHR